MRFAWSGLYAGTNLADVFLYIKCIYVHLGYLQTLNNRVRQ